MELTEQQKKFCREYMKDFNGKQAAVRAGYSEKTAQEQSSRLLSNVKVAIFLESLKDKAAEKNEQLTNDIIEEIKKCGFSNIQNYLDGGNEIKDLSTISVEHAACVESIKKTVTEFGEDGTKTSIAFKLHSKLDALEKLAKYVGLYEADNKQRGAIITVNIDD
jgi:phage terminase small subunit